MYCTFRRKKKAAKSIFIDVCDLQISLLVDFPKLYEPKL